MRKLHIFLRSLCWAEVVALFNNLPLQKEQWRNHCRLYCNPKVAPPPSSYVQLPRNLFLPHFPCFQGASLKHALSNDIRDAFYQLVSKAAVVLCCRVSPSQKAEVVSLMKKEAGVVTLAVGVALPLF